MVAKDSDSCATKRIAVVQKGTNGRSSFLGFCDSWNCKRCARFESEQLLKIARERFEAEEAMYYGRARPSQTESKRFRKTVTQRIARAGGSALIVRFADGTLHIFATVSFTGEALQARAISVVQAIELARRRALVCGQIVHHSWTGQWRRAKASRTSARLYTSVGSWSPARITRADQKLDNELRTRGTKDSEVPHEEYVTMYLKALLDA